MTHPAGATVRFLVFVLKSPGRSGATKVQIAERRGGRDAVLEHVGTPHDEAEPAAPMAGARSKRYPGQGDLPLQALADAHAGQAAGPAFMTSQCNAVLWQVLRTG